MNDDFEKNKEYIIEYVMQLKISKFIKENRNMDKKLLAQKIDEMLQEKEKMHTMDEEELKEVLKNKRNGEIKND